MLYVPATREGERERDREREREEGGGGGRAITKMKKTEKEQRKIPFIKHQLNQIHPCGHCR